MPRSSHSWRIADLAAALEGLAPCAYAEAWDNVGLLAGDPRASLGAVLLTVDFTPDVAREAVATGVGAVVAYHPPIFRPLKRLEHASPVVSAVERGIALYSLHTALDVAAGGTNDVLADTLELGLRRPLRPHPAAAGLGLGRIGEAPRRSRRALVARLKGALGLEQVLVAGPMRGTATCIAVAAGAGGDLLTDALAQAAEVFVTGELKHHDALRAAAAGTTVVCTRHSASERAVLAVVRAHLARHLPGVRVAIAKSDRDPFSFV